MSIRATSESERSAARDWFEGNQEFLTACLDEARHLLEERAGSDDAGSQLARLRAVREEASQSLLPPAALEMLEHRFQLSPFETSVLLLCAGHELDRAFEPLTGGTGPTFQLALARLPEAHWSALAPGSALRYWRLIEIDQGPVLVTSRLRIDERILHYLAGVNQHDDRLAGYFAPVREDAELLPSHQALAERIATHLGASDATTPLPAVELSDGAEALTRRVAAASCRLLECDLFCVVVNALPSDPRECEALVRLWRRETMLSRCALLLSGQPSESAPEPTVARQLAQTSSGPVFFGDRCFRPPDRAFARFRIESPHVAEQKSVWTRSLGTVASQLDGQLDRLAAEFRLDASSIESVTRHVLREPGPDADTDDFAETLWELCRSEARPDMGRFAEPVVSDVTWDDLVLPANQLERLRDIWRHAAHRHRVFAEWPFAARGSRGQGISALFTGASGTGKTMAAEVLANELRLDLYRVDLSRVVSKYIGETEKNLSRVFDLAEGSGAILLFDEADALFGKRSEVRDSHDRYANIEVSYLLQRMESYRGLAILTSNMKEALDRAFLRRFRFLVAFPFPTPEQRQRIWERLFPPRARARHEELDYARLASLDISGGNIHNVAVFAAFEAVSDGEPVSMKHLLRAAKAEYSKMEKSLELTTEEPWA